MPVSRIRSRARAVPAPLVRARRRIAGAGLHWPPRDGGAAAASAPRGSAAAAAGTRAEGIRVLVVDDEASIRALCRVNLKLAGFVVAEAENGRAALEAIERDRPDVVLLDVMMPGLDGWEVATRLRADARTSGIPVVFLSARAGLDDHRRGFEAGGVAYIVKPFDPLALAETLERVLQRISAGEREALRAEILGRS